MRLMSYGAPGYERPGVLIDDDHFVPLGQLLEGTGIAVNNTVELLTAYPVVRSAIEGALRENRSAHIPVSSVRLGPPVPAPGKIIGIGFNYSGHGAGVLSGARPPGDPVVFLKPQTSLCGPLDDIIKPPETQQLDYEVELAIVIGRRGRRIRVEDAFDYVAGYVMANDITARDVAFGPGVEHPLLFQITRAKGFQTFCPLGPWMITEDELRPEKLSMTLSVNGENRQSASTEDMIVSVPELIASVSSTMELYPGDLILTGTPPGCGFQLNPPEFLQHEDLIVGSIEKLGRMTNRVVNEQTNNSPRKEYIPGFAEKD